MNSCYISFILIIFVIVIIETAHYKSFRSLKSAERWIPLESNSTGNTTENYPISQVTENLKYLYLLYGFLSLLGVLFVIVLIAFVIVFRIRCRCHRVRVVQEEPGVFFRRVNRIPITSRY